MGVFSSHEPDSSIIEFSHPLDPLPPQMTELGITSLKNYLATGRVNEYPKMHYHGIPRNTQSIIAYKILIEYFWKFQ